MTTLSVTSEFRHEFEAERTAWLRKRFLWYSAIVVALSVLDVSGAITSLALVWNHGGRLAGFGVLATSLGSMMIFLGPFMYVKRKAKRLNREGILRLVTMMIVGAGLLNLVEIPVAFRLSQAGERWSEAQRSAQEAKEAALSEAAAANPEAPTTGVDAEAKKGDSGLRISMGPGNTAENSGLLRLPLGMVWLWSLNLMPMLIFASLFLPWTPRESYRPVWPLVVCGAVFIVVYGVIVRGAPLWMAGVTIAGLPIVGLPSAGIAAWRHGRFRSRFSYRMLRGAYGDMKRELLDARKIHEDLFPEPIVAGPIRMAYRYEPMRLIGGDYLFARMVQVPGKTAPVFDAALIDVTGHGISAALTVNRLHGEIQRQLGEKPNLSPGAMLKGLNSYLHHTLATHSVYATAICVRIDPESNTIEWSSAGHPPAFLCTADGRFERMESTAFILGVTATEDYQAPEQRLTFMPGDSVVMYTDGAIEARDAGGRHLRVDGLQRILAGLPNGADRVGTILETVDRHRVGPVEDDTLIVEIRRPVEEK